MGTLCTALRIRIYKLVKSLLTGWAVCINVNCFGDIIFFVGSHSWFYCHFLCRTFCSVCYRQRHRSAYLDQQLNPFNFRVVRSESFRIMILNEIDIYYNILLFKKHSCTELNTKAKVNWRHTHTYIYKFIYIFPRRIEKIYFGQNHNFFYRIYPISSRRSMIH